MMRNPWLQKNPFLSMWLSAFNTALSYGRGQAARTSAAATQRTVRELTNAAMPGAVSRGRKKTATASRSKAASGTRSRRKG